MKTYYCVNVLDENLNEYLPINHIFNSFEEAECLIDNFDICENLSPTILNNLLQGKFVITNHKAA